MPFLDGTSEGSGRESIIAQQQKDTTVKVRRYKGKERSIRFEKDDDESAHQILSYGLLFLTFYHFPHTTDPLTCTTPRLARTFAWSPLTIPYTHHTIGLAPCCRSFIWLTDHIVLLSFLSSFSITWHILLWADWSQAITPCGQDLTICFAAHKPCAHFIYHLYLKTLVSTLKKKEVFPQELRLKFVPPYRFTSLCLVSMSKPRCVLGLIAQTQLSRWRE